MSAIQNSKYVIFAFSFLLSLVAEARAGLNCGEAWTSKGWANALAKLAGQFLAKDPSYVSIRNNMQHPNYCVSVSICRCHRLTIAC